MGSVLHRKPYSRFNGNIGVDRTTVHVCDKKRYLQRSSGWSSDVAPNAMAGIQKLYRRRTESNFCIFENDKANKQPGASTETSGVSTSCRKKINYAKNKLFNESRFAVHRANCVSAVFVSVYFSIPEACVTQKNVLKLYVMI